MISEILESLSFSVSHGWWHRKSEVRNGTMRSEAQEIFWISGIIAVVFDLSRNTLMKPEIFS
jgi:hypothetical protein